MREEDSEFYSACLNIKCALDKIMKDSVYLDKNSKIKNFCLRISRLQRDIKKLRECRAEFIKFREKNGK